MPAPTPHQQALGIHPGAFVQPTAPATTDAQDGVLWVDTSSDPPYQLRVWNAGLAQWHAVGTLSGVDPSGALLSACLHFAHGQQICGDLSGILRFILGAVSAQLDQTGLELPSGHRVDEATTALSNPPVLGANPWVPSSLSARIWHGPGFDLSAAPPGAWADLGYDDSEWASAVQSGLMGTNNPFGLAPAITYPVIGGAPDGDHADFDTVWYIRQKFSVQHPVSGPVFATGRFAAISAFPYINGVYCDNSSPDATVAHNLRVGQNVVAWRLIAQSGGTWASYGIYTDGPEARTQHTLRLVHAEAGLQVQLPFEPPTGLPALYLGRDPASGLPAWSALPSQESQYRQLSGGAPAASDTCTQVKCGAVHALVDHLVYWYQWFQGLVGALLSALGSTFATMVIGWTAALIDLLTDGAGLVLSAEESALLEVILKALPGVTGAALALALPPLSSDAQEWLRQRCFCALSCSEDIVALDQGQMQAWQSAVAQAPPGVFVNMQRDVCAAILLWGGSVGLLGWQEVCSRGAAGPRTECDAYTCP